MNLVNGGNGMIVCSYGLDHSPHSLCLAKVRQKKEARVKYQDRSAIFWGIATLHIQITPTDSAKDRVQYIKLPQK